jgi:alpha-L-rhamnosidase
LDHVERAARTTRHPDRQRHRPDPAPHEAYLWDTGFHWGEWLVPGEDLADFPAFMAADQGDVATAYFARSAEILAGIAHVLDRPADAARYADLSARVRDAWQTEYLGADGRLTPDTQANHVRALAFGLVPVELRAAVADRLVELIRQADTHLGTGFLATPLLLPALAEIGHLDVAYELLFADTEPSWLVMIDRGSTTLWERWNGVDADGIPSESLNHYSKGAVVSFLHRYVGGLQLLDDPAYRRFRVQPQPGGGITWATTAHESPYGRIEVAWRITADLLVVDVTVPPGTVAEVVLPDGSSREAEPGAHTFQMTSLPRIG